MRVYARLRSVDACMTDLVALRGSQRAVRGSFALELVPFSVSFRLPSLFLLVACSLVFFLHFCFLPIFPVSPFSVPGFLPSSFLPPLSGLAWRHLFRVCLFSFSFNF